MCTHYVPHRLVFVHPQTKQNTQARQKQKTHPPASWPSQGPARTSPRRRQRPTAPGTRPCPPTRPWPSCAARSRRRRRSLYFCVWGLGVGGFGVRMCRYRVYVSDRIQPHKDTSPKPSEKRKRTLRRHGLRPLGVEELGAVLHPQRRLQVLGVHVLCFFSGSIGCVDGVKSVKEGQGSSQICPEALWGCTCTTTDKGS